MTITPTEAADIARRHGLTLNDAAGLLQLADDAEGAETIAARFAKTDNDNGLAELTARIFPRRPDVVLPASTPPSNEGTNPSAEPDGERTTRRYVARLFNTPDQDTI